MSGASRFPQCRDCPYWMPVGGREMYDGDDVPVRSPDPDRDVAADRWSGNGECHRHAPRAVIERYGGPLFVEEDLHAVAWPRTHEVDWCGDHPGFGAFLAMRYQRSRAPLEGDE